MADYTAAPAPHALHGLMGSRERTAHWVRTHSPTGGDFYSPSVPPSELPPTPSSPPSEVDSSYSLPPKMILRYQDGRPDISVSHWHYDSDSAPRGAPRRGDPQAGGFREQPHGHSRSHSHNPVLQSDRGRTGRQGPQYRRGDVSQPFPFAPEEIRVWPSDSDEVPQTYPRSKSLPRDTYARQDAPPPPMPPLQHPVHHITVPTMYPPPGPHRPQPRPNIRTNAVPLPRPVPWHSMAPPQIPNPRPPPGPAMMYAQPQRLPAHYPPPTLYPTRPPGPEGMRLTRSDPIQYPGTQKPPFPVFQGTATSHSSINGDRRPTRGVLHTRPRTPASDHGSNDSGSTYYVVPTPGQKHHVMVSRDAVSCVHVRQLTFICASHRKNPYTPRRQRPSRPIRRI